MKPSLTLEKSLKAIESLRLVAYMPTPQDKPTIGYGSTGPDIKLGMVWTLAQCEARFQKDLARFAEGVTLMIGSARTSQHEFDAMVSLAYNIGLANFQKSSVLREHIAGRHLSAKSKFGLWIMQKGKVLLGLVRRRKKEADLYGS